MKMMRDDPEDINDIEFLLQQEPLTCGQLRAAFAKVRLPDIQELKDLFCRMQPKVLALAASVNGTGAVHVSGQ